MKALSFLYFMVSARTVYAFIVQNLFPIASCCLGIFDT